MTTLTGGTLTLPAGVSLTAGQTLRGQGTLIGPINALAGSLIEATGPLTLGDPNSPTGFATQGELRTGGFTVTLKSAGPVSLGPLTTLGAGCGGDFDRAERLVARCDERDQRIWSD